MKQSLLPFHYFMIILMCLCFTNSEAFKPCISPDKVLLCYSWLSPIFFILFFIKAVSSFIQQMSWADFQAQKQQRFLTVCTIRQPVEAHNHILCHSIKLTFSNKVGINHRQHREIHQQEELEAEITENEFWEQMVNNMFIRYDITQQNMWLLEWDRYSKVKINHIFILWHLITELLTFNF